MWEIGDQCRTFGLDPCLILGIPPTSWGGFMWRRAVWRQWRWADRRMKATHQVAKHRPEKTPSDIYYETVRTFTFDEAIGLKKPKAPDQIRNVRAVLGIEEYDEDGNPLGDDWFIEDGPDADDTLAEGEGWPED